jgi:hypothetical protein
MIIIWIPFFLLGCFFLVILDHIAKSYRAYVNSYRQHNGHKPISLDEEVS